MTNAHYARFVADNGYKRDAFWSGTGLDWLKWKDLEVPRLWGDPAWDNPLFPVVAISSYEAEAYAHWLDEYLRQKGLKTLTNRIPIPPGYSVRLPSEVEWERCARGTEGRIYPWGNRFDFAKANVLRDGGPGILTTAVCTYRQGESPIGAWDMAGNVCERMLRPSGKNVFSDVMRGGSWDGDQSYACCAAHDWYPRPGLLNNACGFRLVLSLECSGS